MYIAVRCIWNAQSAADAPDGLQQARVGWVILEFFTNPADMDSNCDIIAHGFQSPDALVQILAAEYLTRMAHQEQEQFILPVLEREFRTVFCNPPRGGLRCKRADGDRIVRTLLRRQPLHLRQMCFYARDKDAWGKRLFNIVIRAEAESTDFIRVGCARRYHQNGKSALLCICAAAFFTTASPIPLPPAGVCRAGSVR